MATNKDGLVPGQLVDFETHQKILNEQRKAAKAPAEKPKPAKKTTAKAE